MIAQDRHSGPPYGGDGGAIVFNLLVPSGQAQHRLVIKMGGHILDRLEDQAGGLHLPDQGAHIRQVPAHGTGQGGVVHLDAAGPDLRGKAQLFVGQFVKLPDRDPDRHAVPRPRAPPPVFRATLRQPGGVIKRIAPAARAGAGCGPRYRIPLTLDGPAAAGQAERYFRTDNRCRDLAISPDGRIFIATDIGGPHVTAAGGVMDAVANPGMIPVFTPVR